MILRFCGLPKQYAAIILINSMNITIPKASGHCQYVMTFIYSFTHLLSNAIVIVDSGDTLLGRLTEVVTVFFVAWMRPQHASSMSRN